MHANTVSNKETDKGTDSRALCSMLATTAQIQSYLDKCWVCTRSLPAADAELSVWSFESHDSPALMTLELGLHSADLGGTQMLSLYCPFWMLNKTGFTLCYRVR